MKHEEKPVAADGVEKPNPRKPAQDKHSVADDTGQKTDRPGFDLGGASGGTRAGTGLGLGEDAFDTPDDRRLPGRRRDNELPDPGSDGPEPRNATAPVKKSSGVKTPSDTETKKDR